MNLIVFTDSVNYFIYLIFLDKFNMMLKYQNNEVESDVTMIKDSFDRAFFKNLL
jgi:hypothetical protein